jgi:putative hemolysin
VRELNGRPGLSLPESPVYVTVAGLVLERLGSVPSGGESVQLGQYRITVTRMAGRRVERVAIERVAEVEPG